jgi:UDPglucose 6-dehydrogenase
VRPGLGFAGATLARDLRCLQKVGKKYHVSTRLVDSVFEINHLQTERVAHMVEEYFKGQLKNKTLAVLGLTYKPGTSTLRRSASLEIIEKLYSKQARIRAHDPKADLSEHKGKPKFTFCRDVYEAAQGSHGILLATEWPEYRDLDFERIKKSMAHPLLLDAKNHLDGAKLRGLGFHYLEIGRGQLV